MKMNIRYRLGNQQGSIIAVVAIAMIAFVAVLAIVFDLGHMHTARQELQNAAEAGALAGTRALFDMPGDLPTKVYPDCTRGIDAAQRAAKANKTDKNQDVIVLEADAQLIRWDWKLNQISPPTPSCNLEPTTGVNGIRVTARRSGAVPAGGGSVSLTFGKIFGQDTADVEVFAVAAVASGLPPGPVNNIAVNKFELEKWLKMDPEELDKILMSPDNGDNAAWCAGTPYKPSASNLKDWIRDGTSPGVQGPPDGRVNLINGNTSTFQTLRDKLADVIASPAVFEGGWLVWLPVVEVTKMVQDAKVVGFQPFVITAVKATTSEKGISFKFPVGDPGLPPRMSLASQGQAYLLPKLVELTPANPK
jgi:hypothetical protein